MKEPYFPKITSSNGNYSARLTIHRAISFILLFLLVASQPVSNFMMSGMEILLVANWLLEWDMRRKFHDASRIGTMPLLIAFLVLLAIHLTGLLYSANLSYGLNDIFKKLPLFAIPLVILASRPLNSRQTEFLFLGFITSVTVATVIGYVRYFTLPDLAYRQIVPFISHIRFSLNVCLSLVLSVWFIVRRIKERSHGVDWLCWIMIADIAAQLGLLFKLRSFTAFVILYVTALLVLSFFWKRIPTRKARHILLALLLCITVSAASFAAAMAHQYYTPVPLMQKPLAEMTANGNPFSHNPGGMVENGNNIDCYVCEKELRAEWPKYSGMHIDSITANGYPVYPTLVRYLNGLGTTKDSAGMTLLKADDIEAIEKGIANPVYLHGSSLKQMCFVMLYEYENFRHRGIVKDFTMLERLELWRNGLRVFAKNPLFGVGTGDVFDVCGSQLAHDNSPLVGTKKHIHNQYITFLVSFGLVGFAIICLAFAWALRRGRLLRMPATTAYVAFVLLSFVSEDTLETLAGCVFSVLFLCLLTVYNHQTTNH